MCGREAFCFELEGQCCDADQVGKDTRGRKLHRVLPRTVSFLFAFCFPLDLKIAMSSGLDLYTVY